jgi:methylenetetrahydrofolate reductase (NADPH)
MPSRVGAPSSARRRPRIGPSWRIEVAAYPEVHPQCRYAARDLRAFRRQDGGRSRTAAITQFFFNPEAYFHFVDAGAQGSGWSQPITPGIMPFHNYHRIAQFAQRDGIDIPRWVALEDGGLSGRLGLASAPSAWTSSHACASA